MKQLVRFCIVGCMNFGISYAVFFLSYRYFPFSTLLALFQSGASEDVIASLRLMGISSIDGAVSNVIGFAAGMLNSFAWNKLWTFKAVKETQKQAFRFVITNLTCLLISTVSIFACTDLNHWPYNTVWIVTMAFVTVINFTASKYWIFA